ncbi:hypothetical protein MMC16_006018 [Acarospora aff. strigata]|nr:hypothetical protein [Acarospora aff. strigata]
MSSMMKNILITGATGKQGGAVIDALLASPSSKTFNLLALTRNPSSASATALAKKAQNIKIIKGDLGDCPAIFKAANAPIWGVFSVTLFFGGGATVETEEQQGKALIDAALANDARHFVFTSAERGGQSVPTNIPHFISKHNIEKHLESATGDGGKVSYTILRPVAFMENLSPDFQGKMFTAMWKSTLSPDRKLQLISTADIGYVAAQAFIHADEPTYKNAAIGLAGDELTFAEAGDVFKKVVGKPMPSTFGFLGQGLMWAMKDLGIMFRWFETAGFRADIGMVKGLHPKIMNFAEWLGKKENKFVD